MKQVIMKQVMDRHEAERRKHLGEVRDRAAAALAGLQEGDLRAIFCVAASTLADTQMKGELTVVRLERFRPESVAEIEAATLAAQAARRRLLAASRVGKVLDVFGLEPALGEFLGLALNDVGLIEETLMRSRPPG